MRIVLGIVTSILVGALLLPSAASATETSRGEGLPALWTQDGYVAGEILIGFAVDASNADRDAARVAVSARVLERFPVIGVERWRILEPYNLEEAIHRLGTMPGVRYAEPNYLLSATTIPYDPLRNELWGMHNLGQTGGTPDADIDALEAWQGTTGSSAVVVGVIDTGIDYNHEDLQGNIWTNPGEDLNGNGVVDSTDFNGVDDDQNGFVDDLRGWDFVNRDNDPLDDNNHGTHVAGTIGARGDNGIGVVGVNWNVKLLPLKFLNAAGSGSTSDAILAINYAASFVDSSGNKVVRITSNSWGGGRKSSALQDAIANSGALFVAAAGNSGSSSKMYPAAYPLDNIISVAATDHNDLLASFSNYGSDWVDLGAPGVSVLSSVRNDAYRFFSGTSMATPHVSGTAALVMAADPTMTNAAVKAAILNNVDPLPSLQGKTLTGGRLNAYRALGAPPLPIDTTPPGAIADFAVDTAATTPDSVRLTWTAPGDDDGFGLAYLYDVRYTITAPLGEGNWNSAVRTAGEPIPRTAGAPESFTVTRLDSETTYYFGIKTVDEAGNPSPMSNVATETTPAPPPGKWFLKTMDSGGNVGDWTSIVLDASGRPYIGYHDGTNGDVKLARWTGTAWVLETLPDTDSYVGFSTSIALDAAGQPHLAYGRAYGGYSWLKYATWTGTSWSIETVDAQAQGVGYYASLALDANGNAHISHYRQWGQQALRYAEWTGSQWAKTSVETGSSMGSWTSIALDANGQPHISYLDGGNGVARYAYRTSAGWTIETIGPSGGYTSLALDAAGIPHVTYRGPSGELTYAVRGVTGWDIQTLDLHSAHTSLKLDADGLPRIAYYDPGGGDLRYARWTGSAWEISVVDSEGDVGAFCALALDANGVPQISYYDATNGDLRYARLQP